VCVTYNSFSGVTKAVIFGCDEKRREAIKSRIDKAGDHVRHPMLIIGILIEMERECLSQRAGLVETKYITRHETFKSQAGFETKQYGSLEQLNNVFGIHRESRNVFREISAVKIQLNRMLAHIEELETGKLISDDPYSPATSPIQTPGSGKTLTGLIKSALAARRTKQVGKRIRDRLLEISAEYEVNLGTCDKVWNDLTLLIQIVCAISVRLT